jgi:DNA modification methylase
MSPKEPFARLDWNRRRGDKPPAADLSLISRVNSAAPQLPWEGDSLLLGDNLEIMTAMLESHQETVDLIYADPPFLTGKAYAARIGRGEDSRKPDSWRTTRGYRDTWRDGAEYLDMLYPRLQAMHRLLKPTGSLYLHLDWHASAYARIILDEIFGPDRLLNEIVWVYHGPSPIRSAFNRKHDTILLYSKSAEYTFNVDDVRVPYKDSTIKTFKSSRKAGFGKQPDLERGKVPEDWWYFPVVARLHSERTGYPTQKPEALLERMLLASSNPGDLVGDFFCGAGTFMSVAARHGRRWLGCDHIPLALHTSYRRLLLDGPGKPFSFWADSSYPADSEIVLECQLSGKNQEMLELSGAESRQGKALTFPDDLVLWEVDFAYDGHTFHSQRQQARDWRSGDLALSMPIPADHGMTAVRVVDVHGRTGVLDLPLK